MFILAEREPGHDSSSPARPGRGPAAHSEETPARPMATFPGRQRGGVAPGVEWRGPRGATQAAETRTARAAPAGLQVSS